MRPSTSDVAARALRTRMKPLQYRQSESTVNYVPAERRLRSEELGVRSERSMNNAAMINHCIYKYIYSPSSAQRARRFRGEMPGNGAAGAPGVRGTGSARSHTQSQKPVGARSVCQCRVCGCTKSDNKYQVAEVLILLLLYIELKILYTGHTYSRYRSPPGG